MWVFAIIPGAILRSVGGVDRLAAAGCYSGFGPAKNDAKRIQEAGLGPIPTGAYLIGAEELDVDKHGPVALHLIPQTGTEVFGRSGFMVHGDSKNHPGAASHGCIIAPKAVREQMADGHDKLLIVVAALSLPAPKAPPASPLSS